LKDFLQNPKRKKEKKKIKEWEIEEIKIK